jgi:Right handed beta helix region
MKRRAFLAIPSLALVDVRPGKVSRQETLVAYPDGDRFRVAGWMSREEVAAGTSAADVLQRALDVAAQKGGGKMMLEAGVYRLDRPLRIPKNTTLCGSGMSTVLRVTSENQEGIGILGVMADRCTISDLMVREDAGNASSLAGVVLDNSADCSIEGVLCRDFKHYGFQIRNGTAFTKLYGCTACNNQESNFRLERLNLDKGARIGKCVPNLINNCYAYGGGHGFDLSAVEVQDVVGCEVYQAQGVAFYLRNRSGSILISGCRSFQGRQQAVFVDSTPEINISSCTFCWHEGNGIELQNCTWGTVSANDIMDCGLPGSPRYNIYLHTDVKGIQITGNSIFNWVGQYPSISGIYEAEDCRDNCIVGNNINYSARAGIMARGKNTVVANNLCQPEGYHWPRLKPFPKATENELYLHKHPRGPVNMERLKEYLDSW